MKKNLGRRFLRLITGITVAVLVGMAGIATAAQIDLLVLYDDYSGQRMRNEPTVFMKSWQDQINTIYRNSGIDLQLRIVGVRPYNGTGSNMSAVVTRMTSDRTIASMRDEVGADFVTQLHRTGSCGVGYQAVDARYAFNVVGISCGAQALAHELGHNMGLAHSRAQGDRSGSAYRYGLGHWVRGVFGTVMSYAWVNDPRQNVSVFSNPNLTCKGQPCGVPEGQQDEADAVKALNNVKDRLANFRPSKNNNGGGSSSGGDDGNTDVPGCGAATQGGCGIQQ